MATGWFDDPYGRHDARWLSGGAPTSLVRDGTVEGTDPVPDDPVLPSPAGANGDTPGAADPDIRILQRRAPRGVLIFVVGIAAVLGALYLIQTPPKLPTHRFTPSAADLAVRHTGGTAVPQRCSSTGAKPPGDNQLGFMINPEDADTEFTVYPGSDMVVTGMTSGSDKTNGHRYQTEFSASAPICAINHGHFYVVRPGNITVYFISTRAHVSVAKVIVTTSSPPTTPIAGWVLLALGGVACVVGIVRWYMRPGTQGGGGNGFRRADDAQTAKAVERQWV